MFFNRTFDNNLYLLKRTMDASILRYNVTADNIANADTPNFKRKVVSFESELKRIQDMEREQPAFEGALMDDSRRLSLMEPRNVYELEPNVTLDYLTTSDNNGNNVDLEQETMAAMNTQLLYQSLLYSTNAEFQRMNIALSMKA
ncbi:MAG: flagellar basal body rod protein FlgB [Spirochaetaceae bacterium]|nr:MAG: flagellar basal body rod protein FlgB [Spirochaetaceae bacterium]